MPNFDASEFDSQDHSSTEKTSVEAAPEQAPDGQRYALPRRQFLATTAAVSATTLFEAKALGMQIGNQTVGSPQADVPATPIAKSIIGEYGSWAAGLVEDPPQLSLRRAQTLGIDFLLNKAYTHTWMTYAPLLPKLLDFPEILGLRAPLPTMNQSCTEDGLYTLPEMQRADAMLQKVFAAASAPQNYSGRFYPGGHKFDEAMQADAFGWLDRWLK